MAKWRVWNKHPMGLTHKEKFKDEMKVIAAGEYILMDYEEAVQFKSQYTPIKKRPSGEDDPAGWKVLHLEPDTGAASPAADVKEFVCHFDGAKFPSQSLLDAYLKSNYSEHTFKDDVLEEEIQREEKVKRGPGRPAKEKTA